MDTLKFGKLGEDYDNATLALERSRQYIDSLLADDTRRTSVQIKIKDAIFTDGSGYVQEALNEILPDGIEPMLRAAKAHLEQKHKTALDKLRDAMGEASDRKAPAKAGVK